MPTTTCCFYWRASSNTVVSAGPWYHFHSSQLFLFQSPAALPFPKVLTSWISTLILINLLPAVVNFCHLGAVLLFNLERWWILHQSSCLCQSPMIQHSSSNPTWSTYLSIVNLWLMCGSSSSRCSQMICMNSIINKLPCLLCCWLIVVSHLTQLLEIHYSHIILECCWVGIDASANRTIAKWILFPIKIAFINAVHALVLALACDLNLIVCCWWNFLDFFPCLSLGWSGQMLLLYSWSWQLAAMKCWWAALFSALVIAFEGGKSIHSWKQQSQKGMQTLILYCHPWGIQALFPQE